MDAGSSNLSHHPAWLLSHDRGQRDSNVTPESEHEVPQSSSHLNSEQTLLNILLIHFTPRLRAAEDLPTVMAAVEADLNQGCLPMIRSESRVVFGSSILQREQLKPRAAR